LAHLAHTISTLNSTYSDMVDALSHQSYLLLCENKKLIDSLMSSEEYLTVLKKVDIEEEKRKAERLEG
jgi:hypothetical protein